MGRRLQHPPGRRLRPVHYGYWDTDADEPNGRARAANELTLTAWDPVSKQPIFKTAAVKVELVREGEGRAPHRRRRPPRPSTPDELPPEAEARPLRRAAARRADRYAARRVAVRLSAMTVQVLDGPRVVAVHERAAGKHAEVLTLDHYLEVLRYKPGALPGATALAQARSAGAFTASHQRY